MGKDLVDQVGFDSDFASPLRSSSEDIERQVSIFRNDLTRCSMLEAVPDAVAILNSNRQIVFANKSFLSVLGLQSADSIYGQRPGEAVGCVHSGANEAGCGTTKFCSMCGAVRAILASLEGRVEMQECRIQQQSNAALDLRVWGTPLEIAGEKFSIFAMKNIADEKRRDVLERIFFHDVLNTANGIRGCAEMLQETDLEPGERSELQGLVPKLTDRLIDEIQSHRILTRAESHQLAAAPLPIDLPELLAETVGLYRNSSFADKREIVLELNDSPRKFVSDVALVSRVIGNMLKNALEATSPGEKVTIGCRRYKEDIVFQVNNPQVMPREVQLQVFQRSFSTKGSGRGLGTYSMKLLGETYLGGKVWFTSDDTTGTSFYLRLPSELKPVKI